MGHQDDLVYSQSACCAPDMQLGTYRCKGWLACNEASTACVVHSGLQLIFVYDSSSGSCEPGAVLSCDEGQPLGRWAPPLLW